MRRFCDGLTDYWLDEFDWRQQEGRPQSRTHSSRPRSTARASTSFTGARPVASGIPIAADARLAERVHRVPARRSIAGRAGFDVVVPSLPGYGFSERPQEIGVNYRHVARMWHELMKRLGYERFGVGGGDFGAGVASLLALDYPDQVVGVHLTNFELLPARTDDAAALTPDERAYLDASATVVGARAGLQADPAARSRRRSAMRWLTRPIGLAAWILEKWRSWTDSQAAISRTKFGLDFLLTLVTLYWATGSMHDGRARLLRQPLASRRCRRPAQRIETPTAFAVFSNYFARRARPAALSCRAALQRHALDADAARRSLRRRRRSRELVADDIAGILRWPWLGRASAEAHLPRSSGSGASGSCSRRYGTLTTTVCCRPSSARRSRRPTGCRGSAPTSGAPRTRG